MRTSIIILTMFFFSFLRSPLGAQTMSKEENQNLPGSDYNTFEMKPGETCQECIDACLNDPKCMSYTFVKPSNKEPNGRCWLKSAIPNPISDPNCISGVKSFFPYNLFLKGEFITFQNYFWSPGFGSIKSGNLQGKDYTSFVIPYELEQLPCECQKACLKDPKCHSWTYVEPGKQDPRAVCWLKTEIPEFSKQDSCISGVRILPTYKSSTITTEVLNSMSENQISNFKNINNILPTWKSRIKATLGDINARNNLAKAELFINQKTFLERTSLPSIKYSSFPVLVKNPEYSLAISDKTKTAVFRGQTIDPTSVNTNFKFKFPSIHSIDAIVTDPLQQAYLKERLNITGRYTVYKARYIIIHGANFGKPNGKCGVNIQFEEIRIDDPKGTPIYRQYELIPYNVDWEQSWYDDFIIAKVPAFASVPAEGRAFLVVYRDENDSFVVSQPINILSPAPNSIFNINIPTYQEGHIAAGSLIMIMGSGFGKLKGDVIIKTKNGIELNIPITYWDENNIYCNVPINFPGESLDEVQGATLFVRSNEFKGTPLPINIKIGPRMVDMWINPFINNYALIARPEKVAQHKWSEQTDESRTLVLVTHYPGCDEWIFSEGNTDTDEYFEKKSLPVEFKLSGFYFQPLNPKTWEDDLVYGLKCLANPAEAGYDWGLMFFGSLFGSEPGKYQISIGRLPTEENPSTYVHFHNTCVGPMDGFPNYYTIGFMVHGPEKYLYKLNQQ
jgi:hypothetical protein